jgi:hypothetical protein
VAAAAPKQLARRYYQLKVGHTAVATHLYRVGTEDSPKCRNCQALQETADHLLVECRQWRRQRVALYKALARAGVPPAGQGEAAPESRFFKDQRATKALLAFLAATNIWLLPWGGSSTGSKQGL